MLSFLLMFFTSFYLQAYEVVDHVHLPSYEGKWYEIVRLPNDFQDRDLETPCYNTTAEYASSRFGRSIRVKNSCTYIENGEEKIKVAKARATIADRDTNAKLRVNFIPIWRNIPILRNFFAGKYWIVGLGPINVEDQYEWSVVLGPGQNRLEGAWILARSPDFIDSNAFSEALAILEENGVNIDELISSRK